MTHKGTKIVTYQHLQPLASPPSFFPQPLGLPLYLFGVIVLGLGIGPYFLGLPLPLFGLQQGHSRFHFPGVGIEIALLPPIGTSL